jgi:hypothetical protein
MRSAVELSTLQIVGNAQHLVGCLYALGGACKKQMSVHAAMVPRSYCRSVA